MTRHEAQTQYDALRDTDEFREMMAAYEEIHDLRGTDAHAPKALDIYEKHYDLEHRKEALEWVKDGIYEDYDQALYASMRSGALSIIEQLRQARTVAQ